MNKYHVIVQGHYDRPVIVEDAATPEAAVEAAKPELLASGIDLNTVPAGTLVSVVPDFRGPLQ